MKRVIEIEKEYNCAVEKAIRRFFKKHQELSYWQETFEYMNDNNIDFFTDDRYANGERNNDWAYALHLDKIDSKCTYICVIERE